MHARVYICMRVCMLMYVARALVLCVHVRVHCVHAYSSCMLTWAWACTYMCMHVRVNACTRARLWLYACVGALGACMCVCNSVRAEARTCTCAHACTFVCLQVHLSHRYVCVRARVRGCVHAHVRSESLLVPFLFLHHLCHGKLQWG